VFRRLCGVKQTNKDITHIDLGRSYCIKGVSSKQHIRGKEFMGICTVHAVWEYESRFKLSPSTPSAFLFLYGICWLGFTSEGSAHQRVQAVFNSGFIAGHGLAVRESGREMVVIGSVGLHDNILGSTIHGNGQILAFWVRYLTLYSYGLHVYHPLRKH